MGRRSKLSDSQWETIKARLTAGEKAADLAREFGVSRSVISERISERVKSLKSVAHKIIEVESELRSLPIAEQVSVIKLADQLRAISVNLGGAAHFGALTAHKLSALAHTQTEKLDDYEPMKDIETLSGIKALTQMANEASAIPLNLLRANKESVDELNRRSNTPEPVTEIEVVIVDPKDRNAPGIRSTP